MDEAGGGGKPSGGGGESARDSPSFVKAGGRQRFSVELRPGETTIVSWRKLVKDAGKVKAPKPAAAAAAPEQPPSVPHPVLEPRIAPSYNLVFCIMEERCVCLQGVSRKSSTSVWLASSLGELALERVKVFPGQPTENEDNDAPPASRFSAVIEKIERLYMGKNSSDEEDLNNVPDDDEYDTEDSFIDDTELDEYFQVDNSAIKHDGFFVNRGTLERTNEPTLSPSQQPKKRRRKDLEKGHVGSDDGHVPNKHVKVGKKAAGRPATSGKNSATHSPIMALPAVNSADVKYQNQINASEISTDKRSANTKLLLDPSPSRVTNGDAILEEKNIDKQKVGFAPPKNQGNKLKDGSVSSDASNPKLNDKSSHAQCKPQSGGLLPSVEVLDQSAQRREKNGIRERSDCNVSEAKNSMQAARKEGSSVKPKGTMLDRAVRELEKVVAESRPPSVEVSDPDQAVKRRMPPEIKQKLAKVARLAQASHGKISKELLSRLMSIVGHLIQLRTLKRNLKIMVNMGLSAKQEKDARFQQVKKEVDEMVKLRVPLMKSKALEQQAGASDDFQEVGTQGKEVTKRKCSMDDALEDKICDLYDLYVEVLIRVSISNINGLEEDAGPQVRKLYAEDQDKIKRKKLIMPKTEEMGQVDAVSVAQYVQEKVVTSANHGSSSIGRQMPNITAQNAAARMPVSFVNGPNVDRPLKQEKVKVSSSNSNDTMAKDALVKKKVKRKPEQELGHIRPEKFTSVQGEERQKSHKQVVGPLQKTNFQSAAAAAAPPSFEQLS
ncbi:hypothetical protein RJ640_012355 [Escallonia rubra]|uniref:Hpc2-related domain-containing protein n=1 Tax=Escallonia rubra TaxID=112253 RepID=A0AA88R6B9_9ASTE|nr:hypothetical protein RJ640_012355 [Escallonia rubra]